MLNSFKRFPLSPCARGGDNEHFAIYLPQASGGWTKGIFLNHLNRVIVYPL
jgi:hypothetical protein